MLSPADRHPAAQLPPPMKSFPPENKVTTAANSPETGQQHHSMKDRLGGIAEQIVLSLLLTLGSVRRCAIPSAGGVGLKRTGLRKPAIRRTSSRRKFAPLGEGGGAIELEILAAVEVAFLVEVVVN